MSAPETLYDLCDQVCEHITMMPKNYVQERYTADAKDWYGQEACGTAFCRAGWMVNILDAEAGVLRSTSEWLQEYGKIDERACQLFKDAGFTEEELKDVHELFNGGANLRRIGTEAYTNEGVKGMRKFMAKHKSKLQAHKLVIEETKTCD